MIARHDIYWVKGNAINRPLVYGGEVSGQRCYVNSPRIKSQPSSEPVLTRNTSASVFSPPSPLGKTGWLEWTGWSRVLPPSQAGSGDNTLQVRLWLIIVP